MAMLDKYVQEQLATQYVKEQVKSTASESFKKDNKLNQNQFVAIKEKDFDQILTKEKEENRSRVYHQFDGKYEMKLAGDVKVNNDLHFNDPKTGERLATIFADGNYIGNFENVVEVISKNDKYTFNMFGGIMRAMKSYQRLEENHKKLCVIKETILKNLRASVCENENLRMENEKLRAQLNQFDAPDKNKMSSNEGVLSAIRKVR